MTYAIRSDSERGLWIVTYSGVVTIAERHQAIGGVFQAIDAAPVRRILVDFRQAAAAPAAASLSNSMEFVDLLAREARGGGTRIAYLSASDRPFDRVLELLFDSRRVPWRRFTDETTALAWLDELRSAEAVHS